MNKYNFNDDVNKIYSFIDPRILDSKLGIIKDIFRWVPEPDDPKLYVAAAISSEVSMISGHEATRFNSGAGLTLKEACLSAVGESIERYACTFINKNGLVKGTYKDLTNSGFNLANPTKFAFYHEKQYKQRKMPFKKFDKNANINWTTAKSLTSNQNVYVPAACTYLPYYPDKDEDLIWFPISTGLSCGKNLDEAILKGIYEVIERDAFSIMWFNKLSMPLIDFDSDEEIKKLIEERFNVPNCQLYMVDMTTEIGIPAVFGILSENSHGLLVAASVRWTKKDAVKKTLMELAQGRITWKKDFVKGIDKKYREDYLDVKDFNDHVNLYTNYSMKDNAKFAYSSSQKVKLDEQITNKSNAEKIREIVNRLDNLGYEILVKDLTTSDVEKCGFKVVRVLIPGLTEISNDQEYLRLGGERIYSVPVKLGYRKRPLTYDELYRAPHPFP